MTHHTAETLLRDMIVDTMEFETDEPIVGADFIEWFAVFREKAQAVLQANRTDATPVAEVEALRCNISIMETALQQIAGTHAERFGTCQTDVEEVPDLSAEEAVSIARNALEATGDTHPPATDVAALVEAAKDNRFYIDCEFDGHNGPLLSMAIVRDDDYSIHMRIAQEAKDPWVRKNVMPLMDQHNATQSGIVYINDVGGVIRAFLGDCTNPVIIADSPVDIGRFCQALSTGSDGGWASADYPQMTFEVHNVDCYPTTLPNAVQHNAWWDAMALRQALAPFMKGQP